MISSQPNSISYEPLVTGLNPSAIRSEISNMERELSSQLEQIASEQARLVMVAVREAEQRIGPLRAYLEASAPGRGTAEPTVQQSKTTAVGRLLAALASSTNGMHRKDADAFVMAAGLSIASARKARQTAEAQGLASRRGNIWTLTATGRMRLQSAAG